MKSESSIIYVTMEKKHSGQAPTPLGLVCKLQQFWPCHTNTLSFKKFFAREFGPKETLKVCQKNIVENVNDFHDVKALFVSFLKVLLYF